MKRRTFLLKSASTAFGFQVVSSHVLRAAEGQNTPNNKIRIAAIGCGGRGGADLGAMAGEDIVALCDVDDRRAAGAFKKFPEALQSHFRGLGDFRSRSVPQGFDGKIPFRRVSQEIPKGKAFQGF